MLLLSGRRAIAIQLLAMLCCGGAFAQQMPGTAGELPDWKYELLREEKGYVRMNRETGAISFCTRISENIVCRLGADEREAFTSEITRLEDRLEALEARLAAVETEFRIETMERQKPNSQGPKRQEQERQQRDDETGMVEEPPVAEREQEFDRAMDMMERAMRRFFDVVNEFRDPPREQ
jgi:hypothetical protein